MENLFKVNQCINLILVVLLSSYGINAQSKMVAHKIIGQPYIEVNDSIKTITKGTIIDKKTTLFMQPNDEITLIDKDGEIVNVINTGKMTLADLSKLPKVKDNSSTLKKYWSYFWKETTNTMASRNNKSGVIYRGDEDIILQFPSNNSVVINSEINFGWSPIDGKEKNYYFILLDSENNIIMTLGTPSTTLSLLSNNSLLQEGETYYWLVTETAYPSNIDELPKYNFSVISKDLKKDKSKEVMTLYKDLIKLGFDKSELQNILCYDFKICL